MAYNVLWSLHKEFWDAFMYPNNVAQAKRINSTLLASNVIGRVDITRVFTGQELNTEYLFGLFTGQTLNAGAAALLGVPISYDIIHFAASSYVVSSQVVVNFNLSTMVIPVEVGTWITFDSNKKITQYDATFRRFDQVLDITVANVQKEIGASTSSAAVAYLTDALAKSVCNTAQTYCNGTNQQYTDTSSCYTALTQTQYMVPARPSVHCPHIGPTGGGMCVDDQTYADIVHQPLYTNAPMVPNGFASKDKNIAAE
ncbi:hypothetical protein LTR56_013462 [Elasticomyces elasticus]|nr:hypothetical protein LTR56_013462 [Elasticomyces elasticus]KAK3652278.1 hypothetical protein LTR22_011780 [Elasticomyces elasticus]KAK4910121.1 hypothetical protein LTR49_021167 [Elasticomyces elasticus]KAK5753922.1 hypothetical protein LTS12_016014 [Elasticomyces elasticus]